MNKTTILRPPAPLTCLSCAASVISELLCADCDRKADSVVQRHAADEYQFQERIQYGSYKHSGYEFSKKVDRAGDDHWRQVERERLLFIEQRKERDAANADLSAWWWRECRYLDGQGQAEVLAVALLAFLKQIKKAMPTKGATKDLRKWFGADRTGKDFPTFDLITLDVADGHLRAYFWTVGEDGYPVYHCLAQQLKLQTASTFSAQVDFASLYELCGLFDKKAMLILQKTAHGAPLVLRETPRSASRLRHYNTPPALLGRIGIAA